MPLEGFSFVRDSVSFVLSLLSIVYFYILCPHVTPSDTTHNTYVMPLAVFEPTVPVVDRPQTLALDSSATAISCFMLLGQSTCFKVLRNIGLLNEDLSSTSAGSLVESSHETEPSSHLALDVYERVLELHPRVL
jgi:hypothetical protein